MPSERGAHVDVRSGLGRGVTDPLVQLPGAGQVRPSLRQRAEEGTGPTQAMVGTRLPGQVAAADSHIQRRPLSLRQVVPVSPAEQERLEGQREAAGVAVVPVAGGEHDRGDQHLMLGFDPGQRLVADGALRLGPRLGGAGAAGVLAGSSSSETVWQVCR